MLVWHEASLGVHAFDGTPPLGQLAPELPELLPLELEPLLPELPLDDELLLDEDDALALALLPLLLDDELLLDELELALLVLADVLELVELLVELELVEVVDELVVLVLEDEVVAPLVVVAVALPLEPLLDLPLEQPASTSAATTNT